MKTIKFFLAIFSLVIITSCGANNTPVQPQDDSTNPPEPLHNQAEENTLQFDGIDDVVSVKDIQGFINSPRQEFSIEAKIYYTGANNGYPRIIDRSDNISDDRFILGINASENKAHFNINGVSINSTHQLTLHKWYNIAATYDGNFMRLYLDGKLEGVLPISFTLSVNRSNIYIGNNELNNRQFRGRISYVVLWNAARTASEITSDFENGPDLQDPELLSYWDLSVGNGQIVPDYKENNNGILGYTIGKESSDPIWERL
jgi:hypothetical protein